MKYPADQENSLDIFFCMDKIIASKVCNNRECDEKSFITKPSWEREVFF